MRHLTLFETVCRGGSNGVEVYKGEYRFVVLLVGVLKVPFPLYLPPFHPTPVWRHALWSAMQLLLGGSRAKQLHHRCSVVDRAMSHQATSHWFMSTFYVPLASTSPPPPAHSFVVPQHCMA